MDDGLTKARRNLIVVSVLLVVFDLAGVSATKITALGTELQIGRPYVIQIFLWFVWAYLLLRYTQLLGDEKDLGIRNAFTVKFDSLMLQAIADFAKQREPRWTGNLAESGFLNLERTGLTWNLRLFTYDTGQGKRVELSVVAIPRRLVIPAMVRAAFHVAFITPKGTEYILPILLAIAAPIAKVVM